MNYLLYQPESLTEKDKVYKDGILLNDSADYGETYDKIVALFERAGVNDYPWMGKVCGLYVIRGLFDSKDELGRTLAFLFASDNPDVKSVIQDISSKIGKEVSDSTYNTIDGYVKGSNNKKLIRRVAIPVVIVLIVILIVTLCSH